MCLLWFKYPLQSLYWNVIVIIPIFRSETFKTWLSHECSAFKTGLMLLLWEWVMVMGSWSKDKICPIPSFCFMTHLSFCFSWWDDSLKRPLSDDRADAGVMSLHFPGSRTKPSTHFFLYKLSSLSHYARAVENGLRQCCLTILTPNWNNTHSKDWNNELK